ncbi:MULTISPECIES: universal stress protein [unclassified Nocardia]|uniref:universal stress protein n=1 Tax=unclassified Nocardia TaxID=2637762 RepID=UPI001CE49D86|nr:MULTISPECIES: universal stress protein [unclassified Nocardia]
MNSSEQLPRDAVHGPATAAAPYYVLCRGSTTVAAVADALADVICGQVYRQSGDAPAEVFLRALADPAIALGVLARDAAAWPIVQATAKPVVLVPEGIPHSVIQRVLVPLDGTEEATTAVAETVRLFRTAGMEIVVLHVFDRKTVPAYWDQAAHARDAWEEEFLARYCTPYFSGPKQKLTLRNGAPGETVVDVAAASADLIVLGWSQQVRPGRAETVRRTVAAATVPVLLVPTSPHERSSGTGTNRPARGFLLS